MSKRIKSRRKLRLSDFRKQARNVYKSIMLCGEHGFINVDKIMKVFPDREERLAYIQALIKGLN